MRNYFEYDKYIIHDQIIICKWLNDYEFYKDKILSKLNGKQENFEKKFIVKDSIIYYGNIPFLDFNILNNGDFKNNEIKNMLNALCA